MGTRSPVRLDHREVGRRRKGRLTHYISTVLFQSNDAENYDICLTPKTLSLFVSSLEKKGSSHGRTAQARSLTSQQSISIPMTSKTNM
jgi:hypothetical protein